MKRISGSAMPFKQMENVGSYIKACAAIGVPSQDLFITVDLYEVRHGRAPRNCRNCRDCRGA